MNIQEQILQELKEIKALMAAQSETQIISNWQAARWTALNALEPHLAKNHTLTVYDILPLPGDPTPEDMNKAN